MKKNSLYESLVALLESYLSTLKINKQSFPVVYFEFPSQTEHGDLSTNLALRLSKILHKPPREIADSVICFLKEKLPQEGLDKHVNKIEIAGAGFLNFFLSESYFQQILKEILVSNGEFGRNSLGHKQKVLVEFVSANPTGPLSVAHARQATVGDALSNILDFLGFEVTREYYLNDEGNQINLLGRSIGARLSQLEGIDSELPEGGYEGEYICDIAKEIAKGKNSKDLKQEILSEYGLKYILDIIKQELDDFAVRFDSWYSQKNLSESGKIEKALNLLKKQGFIYNKDGAVWFKSTQFGDDKDRVIIKSDGEYTYLTPDIAYHRDKYKRGFNWVINLWGPDHHGYIPRIKAAVQALGNSTESLNVIIVQLATIFRDGKPLPMSTRKGQYITLREILDEVGRDASRFFFLMRRTSAHLDFDLELAKKQSSENPVYYVQYAHARICSIMRNADFKFSAKDVDLSLLIEPQEFKLIKTFSQLPHVLENCYKNVDPYFITAYLQELAEDLHKFYERCRVLSDDQALTRARLSLIFAARIVLSQGLKLLGVSAPEKM